jgi:hypothetical protein
MAAGLGFKTFTTGEVLTAADTNGYLMQGVLVFANAAARTAAITSPQEGQMSYLSDTNSTEYYSGSAWVAIASASLTLLSTTTLSGATVTVSSISQSYTNLFILISGMTNATANGLFRIAPNGTTTISHGQGRDGNSTLVQYNATYLYPLNAGSAAAASPQFNDANNSIALTINNYTSTTAYKTFNSSSIYVNNGLTPVGGWVIGGIATNTAISSLVFSNAGGNLSTGTVLIYGVK